MHFMSLLTIINEIQASSSSNNWQIDEIIIMMMMMMIMKGIRVIKVVTKEPEFIFCTRFASLKIPIYRTLNETLEGGVGGGGHLTEV